MRWSAYREGGPSGSGPWTVTVRHTDGTQEDYEISGAGNSPSRAMEIAKLRRERARWGLVAQDAWFSYQYGWYEEATRKIGEIEKAIYMLKKSEQDECGQAVRNPNAIRQ